MPKKKLYGLVVPYGTCILINCELPLLKEVSKEKTTLTLKGKMKVRWRVLLRHLSYETKAP